jgi:sugar/nucleoside kinase (ribokinase family)
VIVVVGSPRLIPASPDAPARVVGTAASVAVAASEAGASVQLVGKVGDDPSGDTVLLALSERGVGHVAVLRDPAHPTPVAPAGPVAGDDQDDDLAFDPADDLTAPGKASAPPSADSIAESGALSLDPGDLDLALRYLGDFRVLVLAESPSAALAEVAADAAAFVGASLIALVEGADAFPLELADATLLAAPVDDPEGAFARVVGRYAAALDRGQDPARAFSAATAEAGWSVAN